MTPTALLTDLLNVAKAAATVIGGPGGEVFAEVGTALSGVLSSVKHLYDGVTQKDVEVTQAELEATIARVNAHANETIGKLGGKS